LLPRSFLGNLRLFTPFLPKANKITIQNLPLAKEFELFIELLFAPKVQICFVILHLGFCFLTFL